MKLTNCIISDEGITTIINGKPYQVRNEHPNYEKILKTLKSKDGDEFLRLYNPVLPKVKPSKDFTVVESLVVGHGQVTYNGTPLHNSVTYRLIALQEQGHDTAPLAKFLVKLLKNPSAWCVEALYKFLESKGLPIDENGDCLAYKVVDENWMDKYSGKFSNTIGSIHQIPRNTVDDDRTKECSYGFHVGDLNYSGPNGSYRSSPSDKTLIVKFSPEDVVAIPAEANAHKIRVAKYQVVSEYKELPDTFVNLSLQDLKYGDKISFYSSEYDCCCNVHLKYEGISSRSKNTQFYGRLLKGTEYGEVGRSASFLISRIDSLKKL